MLSKPSLKETLMDIGRREAQPHGIRLASKYNGEQGRGVSTQARSMRISGPTSAGERTTIQPFRVWARNR